MTIRNLICCAWILGGLSCVACFSGCREAVVTPVAENGVLDLRQWGFETRGNIELNGRWNFYWQQMVPPSGFSREVPPPPTGLITVPYRWNGFQTGTGKISGTGFATYHLRVLLPAGNHRLGIKLLDMATAFTLYINGKRVAGAGAPGKTRDASTPAYRPQVLDIGRRSGTLDIVCHVSNFHHWQGGFWEPVHLGRFQDIRWQRERNLILVFFLMGSILIMGIYHLGMFVIRMENRSVLYFGLFNLIVAVRMLITWERLLFDMAGGLGFRAGLQLEYLSFLLALPAFTQYVQALFPGETSKKVVGLVWGVSGGLCLFVLAAPLPGLTRSMPPFQVFTLGIVGYGAWVAVAAVRRRRQGALAFLGGFLVLAATVVNDILYTRQMIYTGHLVPWGFFVFIFSQALLLYQRFSLSFNLVEDQWRELARTTAAYEKALRQKGVAQDALKASEAKYRGLIENSADGICIVRKGLIVYANPRFLKMFDVDPGRIGALSFLEFVHPRDRETLTNRYTEWKKSGRKPWSISLRGKQGQGQVRHFELSVSAIDWEAMPSVITLVRDVTEQVRTRELLFQSEKMLSIGGLAAGMAHEINNPLAGMMANAQLVQHRLASETPANAAVADRLGISLGDVARYAGERDIHRSLEHIMAAGRHAAEIVDNMLSFARKSGAEKDPWPLEEIVDKALALAGNDFRLKSSHGDAAIHIDKQVEHGIGPVLCEESKIRQVLLNLFKNAVQAMGGREDKIRRPRINIRIFQEAGLACLSVSDNGPGMPESVRKRIFEPFFTTREKARGTGLGLSISYYIITEDHGGQMDVASAPGRGTVFTIRLPLA